LTTAVLALEDGTFFKGISIGAIGNSIGEVVFNTAMTGYQEILTDPSYYKQIVTLTYPHIGNTGTNNEDYESRQSFAAGLVIREASILSSSWRNQTDFRDFLIKENIVAIADIDTRRLTNHIRTVGSLAGCITTDTNDFDHAISKAKEFPGLNGLDLAKEVSTKESYEFKSKLNNHVNNNLTIVAYDFGIKNNILNILSKYGCNLIIVPAATNPEEVLSMKPDGIFLSNGPGDPEPCTYAIESIKEYLNKKIPIFGICLGHQLLAIASGAKTVKMKFGHHGANHPVKDLSTGNVLITSQNHGFTVDERSIPLNVKITHRSLFDNSIQGIELNDSTAYGFQGHPEASPGPHDVSYLFTKFIELMKNA